MSSQKPVKENNYYDTSSNIAQNPYDNWSMITDIAKHTAQGVSQGFYDEATGAIGGTGRVMANGVMRALGQPVNNESFVDAWNKGYRDYRDFARQELDAGYRRNPIASGIAEVVGSAMSPIKVHTPKGYIGQFGQYVARPQAITNSRYINALGNAVINGVGSTDNNTWQEYAVNIGLGLGGNIAGTGLGNRLWGRGNMMYPIQRSFTNAGIQYSPYFWKYINEKKTF